MSYSNAVVHCPLRIIQYEHCIVHLDRHDDGDKDDEYVSNVDGPAPREPRRSALT